MLDYAPRRASLTCRVTSSVLRTARPREAQATRPRVRHTNTRHIANHGSYASPPLAYLDGHAYSVWVHPRPNTDPRGLIDSRFPLIADWLLVRCPFVLATSSLRPPNIPLLYLFPKHRPSLPVYKSASQHVRSLARLLLCLLSLSSPLRAPKSRDLVLSSSRLSTLVSSLWALSAISAVILRPRPRPSPDSRHFSTSRAAFDSVRRARDYPRVHRATTPVTLSARLTV